MNKTKKEGITPLGSANTKPNKNNKKNNNSDNNIETNVASTNANSILLSDDVIDYLDSEIDRFNETKNLGDKISLHSKLIDTINTLETEIDAMINNVDKMDAVYVNMNDKNEKLNSNNNDDIDINDD